MDKALWTGVVVMTWLPRKVCEVCSFIKAKTTGKPIRLWWWQKTF